MSAAASHPDPWLRDWLHTLLAQRGQPMLELGSGPGHDTAFLAAHGFDDITACDIDPQARAQTAARVPCAHVLEHDLSQPLPFGSARFGLVVASLSLHYFDWPRTLALAGEIHQTLTPGGLLALRVNSTNDVHYGATGHRELAPHYYDVGGSPKRFFDEAELRAMFAKGWEILSLRERTIARYEKPKVAWEALARKELAAMS